MLRIIKVEETDMYGYAADTKYFKSLNKAKKYFNKLFKRHKEDLTEKGDGYQKEPIYFRNTKATEALKGKRYKEAAMECWYEETSEDGTEYGTEIISISLQEIKIED